MSGSCLHRLVALYRPWRTWPGLVSVLFVLMLFGCASAQSPLDESISLGSWKGKTRQDLMMVLGPPTHETASDNGMATLTWEQSQRHASGIGRMSQAESYYTVCIREFTIDSKGVVIGESERGCQ